MKKALRMVLSMALFLCVLGTNAQRQNNYDVLTDVKTKDVKANGIPEVKVLDTKGAAVVYLIDGHHFPYDVSDNGQHVAIQGFGEYSSYYWSDATGIVPMDGYAFAISDNGVIAGYFMDETLGANVAGMWFPDVRQWTFLGMNPEAPEILDMEYNSAWAMTNDGSTLAVMQVDPAWNTLSYLWTADNGYVRLNTGSTQSSRPMSLSADARVVAGHGVADLGWVPCYWIDGEYHTFDSQYMGESMAVSNNGNYVVGYLDGAIGQAFVYDITNDSFTTYPNPNGEGSMSATCVSDNGEVFGYSASGFPAMPETRRAFAIVGGQLMTFNEYLAMNGFEEAVDWTFYSINSITANGKIFSGAANIDGADYSIVIMLEDSDCEGPANLTYTIDDVNFNDIVLNWDAPANPVDVTYEIYTGYTAQTPMVSGITETTYTFEDLEPGTYSYIVKANWGGECISAGSNMVSPIVYACPSSEMCELTIELRDEYGDGWNGAYFEIVGNEGNVLYQVTLNNGNTNTVNLPFCNENLTFTWVPGEWDAEIGFTIFKDEQELYNVDKIEEPLGTFLEYELICYDDVTEIETEMNVSILPNPANSFFNVKAENISMVEVYNAVGQTIEVVKANNSNNVHINTAALENGVYFVKVVTTDSDAIVKRVVVSK